MNISRSISSAPVFAKRVFLLTIINTTTVYAAYSPAEKQMITSQHEAFVNRPDNFVGTIIKMLDSQDIDQKAEIEKQLYIKFSTPRKYLGPESDQMDADPRDGQSLDVNYYVFYSSGGRTDPPVRYELRIRGIEAVMCVPDTSFNEWFHSIPRKSQFTLVHPTYMQWFEYKLLAEDAVKMRFTINNVTRCLDSIDLIQENRMTQQ